MGEIRENDPLVGTRTDKLVLSVGFKYLTSALVSETVAQHSYRFHEDHAALNNCIPDAVDVIELLDSQSIMKIRNDEKQRFGESENWNGTPKISLHPGFRNRISSSTTNIEQTVPSTRFDPFPGFCRTGQRSRRERFGFVLSFNQFNLDCGTD